jgi:molecular chaperone HscB
MAELNILDVKQAYHGPCSHCGTQFAGVHFCSGCKKIQPVSPDTDYFSFFGLPKKLRLDEVGLEKTFYSLSRELHPDYFMSASEEERRASVEHSSMLNDAYRTLRDRARRAQYLLQLEGYKEAEKKAPPDLLEEVFELNMQIEELKAAKKMGDPEEIAEVRSSLEQQLGNLKEKLAELDKKLFASFADWDATVDRDAAEEERKAILNRMSQLLSHRSYIRNLVRDVKEEL